MRKMALISAGLAAAALVAGAAQAAPRLTGEAKLAKILDGRVAGEPVDCIPNYNLRSRVIDDTAIVYEHGSTLYVNRPVNARDLDSSDVLVNRNAHSRLCRVDTLTTVDNSTWFYTGNVFLGDFVPYRRASQTN